MASTNDPVRLTAVNHLTYNVKDMDRALKFWVEMLGIRQIPSQVNSETVVWLQLPSGAMVHLVETPDAPSVPSHHGAFEVEDIEAAKARLHRLGVKTTDINTRNDGQRAMFLNDTEGNRIEICTRSGFPVLV